MDIALDALPIPDWGLICPTCRYPLRGLPSHRCPECGTEIDVAALIRPWTRLRAPRFTGLELPLPDFGLSCAACGAELVGARTRACPSCGVEFDPQAWQPRQEWFVVDHSMCDPLPVPGVHALLAGETIPHIPIGERGPWDVFIGHGPVHERLRVAREFYFEVRWLIQEARKKLAEVRSAPGKSWRCAACGESNPAHFDICWKCQADKAGE